MILYHISRFPKRKLKKISLQVILDRKMDCSVVAWEYVSSPFSRDKSFTSHCLLVVFKVSLNVTENYLAVWEKCLDLGKNRRFHFLTSVFDNVMSCIGGFLSFHVCFLPLMFLKHAGESQEEWEDSKARSQGARSGGDTNQFSKILGSGNKGILGESNHRNRCSTWRT